MIRALLPAALVLTLVAAGCNSQKTTDAPEEAATVVEVTPAQADMVQKFAAIALELQANPDGAEEILARHGLNPDEWSGKLLEIAKDPALSRLFQTAIAR